MLAEKETLSITINPSEAVESAAEESASAYDKPMLEIAVELSWPY